MYDPENVFAKVLKGLLPVDPFFESEHTLAFKDIHPQAPHHILLIPKGAYVSSDDFFGGAPEEEQVDFFKAIRSVTHTLGLHTTGYRLISNHGVDAHQEVPHFHMHILGGRELGPLLASKPTLP